MPTIPRVRLPFLISWSTRVGAGLRGCRLYGMLCVLLVGGVGSLLGPLVNSFAEDYGTAASQRNATGKPRLLVLRDGSIMQGHISILDEGYSISTSNGVVAIPFDAVTCDAVSIQDAYRQQRDAIVKPSAEQHTRLAGWCLQQQLYEQAERELEAALGLQAHYPPALRMIEQIRKQQAARSDPDELFRENKKQMEDLLVKLEFGTAEPLGGLSPELAQEFSSRVELLLINTCANGACHGRPADKDTAEYGFRLTPRWNMRGNTRHVTDQNLRAVLAQLDLDNPEASPLIAVLDGRHGARNTPVFKGAKAAEQRKLLENWTILTARYLASTRPAKTENSPLNPAGLHGEDSRVIQASGETSFIAGDQSSASSPSQTSPHAPRQRIPREPTLPPGAFPATGQETPLSPASSRHPSQPEQQATPRNTRVEEALRNSAPDPFDPALFNRKVHGRD